MTEAQGMSHISYIDTEIDPESHRILDIGGIKDDGSIFHKTSIAEFVQFLGTTQFICGHNIINHDIKYIGKIVADAGIKPENIIDTLYLSPLLFPTRPYHALLKDDKLQTEDLNNPLNDSIKARDLFHDEIVAFNQTDENLKQFFYLLLKDKKEFNSFFRFINYTNPNIDIEQLIRLKFKDEICENINLTRIIEGYSIELAYCLSLINSFIYHKKIHSITPPWVLKNYPEVERLMLLLRNKPCISGCVYCSNALDIHKGLKKFFGFDSYRIYDGEALQQKAVQAAVNNKSLLAVFPTGGGKSITFQVPALMTGENLKGLTMHLSYKDVWLDFFINKQHLVSELHCGDILTFNGNECVNSRHQPILRFSKQFQQRIEQMKTKKYELKSLKVNFIVYWLKEDTLQEIKIILPEVYFEKAL